MEDYLQEALQQGYIWPSTLPASAGGFFSWRKKEGGLHPCIDYSGLNQVTIKYYYPLPLIPVALNHPVQPSFSQNLT